MTLNEKQRALCENHGFDFSDLKALYINCTLKPSPEFSHTEALMKVSEENHGRQRRLDRDGPGGGPDPAARRVSRYARTWFRARRLAVAM
ncbi:MAG: hypothetical protein U5K38_04815 [Woeseiaceae bacterium]|nr:hypothetical protein [Woeseiaceae bacterium]